MLNAHDRRDLASLGLMVLVYGLAVAPVLHAVVGHGGGGARREHAHVAGESAHTHDAHHRDGPGSPDDSKSDREPVPDGHQHLTGSVEHLHAVATAWAAVEVPRVRTVSWRVEVLRGLSRAPGAAPRLTAMPQGP